MKSQNSDYWNFICGSAAAKRLGIKPGDTNELFRFDRWYFDFYPYLQPFLARNVPQESPTLEIGLGFGTVSQWLGERQHTYIGIDIAQAPVNLVQNRLAGVSAASAIVGDVRSLPFENHAFGAVVSIGALHHSGSFHHSLEELVRVTKPGGTIVGMVYSLLSGRNLLIRPISTLFYCLRNIMQPAHIYGDEELRAWSDQDEQGLPPPSTEYFSRRGLRAALSKYGHADVFATNLDELPIPWIGKYLRKWMLRVGVARLFGLDLYFVLKVPENSKPNAME